MQNQSGSDSQDNFQLNKLNPSWHKPEQVIPKAESKLPRVSLGRPQAPRLIIDFIELQNFKSYANKQKIGPFHHNFSSVVGPNGSGKSNLIESLLFIFGYKANWMRQSKLAQLIHHSSVLNDVQKAVVSVHFRQVIDNDDGSISNVPRSQFSVRRSVNTQSISKYYINDVESTQTEVKELLMSKGIDLSHNRFLILQGEVEQIASMKQKSGNKDGPGLLQYLEDIIGSSQFVTPLEELTKKFNELDEKRHERGERMKLSETQLKGMTKGKDEAVRYVKREKRMYQLDNAYLQIMRKKTDNAFLIHEGRLKQAELNKIKIIEEAKVRLAAQTDRQKEIRQIKQQINENTKAESRLAAQFDKLTQKDKFLRDQCKYKTEDQFKYKKKSEELNKEYTKIIQESKQACEQLPKRIEQLKSLIDEIKKFQEELDRYGPQENPKELNNMQSQLKEMDMNIASLQEKRDHYQQKLNKLQQMENAGQNQTSDRQVQAQEVIGKLKEYNVRLERANQILQKQLEAQRNIQGKRERLRNQIQAIDAMFRERQADRQQQGDRGTMHQQIMKQRFPGVVGRLCDIGSVDREYDEIISSSCFQLESMVVQTYEAGQAIVEFLKRTKLGKVTCIILDKIPEFVTYMNKHFQAPNGSVRLFDLIKPHNQNAKVAFYYALRDTLYCKDSNLANKIAYDPSNRRRVVTYAQNRTIRVIEMNGTMSSNRIRQGLLSNKGNSKKGEFDDKDVMKLEADREKLQYDMKSLQEQKRNNDGRIFEVEGDIAQMERLKKTLEIKLQNINDELKYTMNRDPVKVTREKQHIQKELGILTAQISKYTQQHDTLYNTVKRLEEDFKRIQSPEVIKLKDRIKDMNQQRRDLEAKVNKFKAKTDSTADRLKKVEHDSQDALRKADDMQKSIEKINAQINGIETEGQKMMVLRVSCEQKIKALKNKEYDLAKLNKDDEELVNESRSKVEAAKADVERQRTQCRKKREESDSYAIQLDQKRGDYTRIVASYDFLRDLDEVQNMFAGERRNSSIDDLSLLDQSTLNVSGLLDNPKMRQLPVDRVYKTEPIEEYSEAEIQQMMILEELLKAQAALEKQRLERVEGSGLAIINEFRDKYREYTERLANLQEVKNELFSVKKIMDEMKEKRLTMFRQGFQIISSKLKEVYQLLTKGGDAELDLIDSLDPFSEGVNFSVRPPKKTWKEINKLSGGEKTLSSLSLVFALHYYKPTPLYFMDQIDAALDYKNVSVVANYIKARTKNAQFIIISLRNNMFELADKLIGVYKTHDQTKTISITPELVMKKIRENEQKENQGIN